MNEFNKPIEIICPCCNNKITIDLNTLINNKGVLFNIDNLEIQKKANELGIEFGVVKGGENDKK